MTRVSLNMKKVFFIALICLFYTSVFSQIPEERLVVLDSMVTNIDRKTIKNLDSLHCVIHRFARTNEERVFMFYGLFAIHYQYDMKRFWQNAKRKYKAIKPLVKHHTGRKVVSERAKEVGIRKVAGAQKVQLILQSLSESIILNFIAIVMAVVLTIFMLSVYNNITGSQLMLQTSVMAQLLPIIGILVLGVVLAGLYPALLLSSYSPSKALKGKEFILIIMVTLLVALGGTTFGLAEETIAFFPILIPVFIAAKYDAMVGLACIFLGSSIGTMCSTVNPFSTIIASDAAGINWTTGLNGRFMMLLIVLIISLWYMLRYAKRVKNDPTKSIIYDQKEMIESLFGSSAIVVGDNDQAKFPKVVNGVTITIDAAGVPTVSESQMDAAGGSIVLPVEYYSSDTGQVSTYSWTLTTEGFVTTPVYPVLDTFYANLNYAKDTAITPVDLTSNWTDADTVSATVFDSGLAVTDGALSGTTIDDDKSYAVSVTATSSTGHKLFAIFVINIGEGSKPIGVGGGNNTAPWKKISQ